MKTRDELLTDTINWVSEVFFDGYYILNKETVLTVETDDGLRFEFYAIAQNELFDDEIVTRYYALKDDETDLEEISAEEYRNLCEAAQIPEYSLKGKEERPLNIDREPIFSAFLPDYSFENIGIYSTLPEIIERNTELAEQMVNSDEDSSDEIIVQNYRELSDAESELEEEFVLAPEAAPDSNTPLTIFIHDSAYETLHNKHNTLKVVANLTTPAENTIICDEQDSEILNRLKSDIEAGQRVVNITGVGHGAARAIEIANQLQKLYPDLIEYHFEINLFLFDPVAGITERNKEEFCRIPPRVKDCTIVIQNDENRTLRNRVQDKSRIIREEHGNPVKYILLPGQHEAAVYPTGSENEMHVLRVGTKLLKQFLMNHNVAIRQNLFSNEEESPLNEHELLEVYSEAKSKEAAIKFAHGKQRRPHVSNKANYFSADSNAITLEYFINDTHRQIFASCYPMVYQYFYQIHKPVNEREFLAEIVALHDLNPITFESLGKNRGIPSLFRKALRFIAAEENEGPEQLEEPELPQDVPVENEIMLPPEQQAEPPAPQLRVMEQEPPHTTQIKSALIELQRIDWEVQDLGVDQEEHSWSLKPPRDAEEVTLKHSPANSTKIISHDVAQPTADAMADALHSIYKQPITVRIYPDNLAIDRKDVLWLAARKKGFEVENYVPSLQSTIFEDANNIDLLPANQNFRNV